MTPSQLAVILGTSAILVTGACKTEQPKLASPPSSSPTSAKTAVAPAAPAIPAAAPAPASAEGTVADFAADPHKHMKAHFVRALKLQDAILAGNLPEAKAQGQWLATHEAGDIPAGWRPHLVNFQAQAKVVADAASADDAAAAFAHIAASCGECHEANHAKPRLGSSPVFKKIGNVKEHMTAQLMAMDKLWDGLVVPSDVAWREGAALLADVAVTHKTIAKEGLDKADSATVLVETLHQLSATAGKAAKEDRPQAYANLLTTCVACHAAVRRPVGVAATTPGAPR
jgi:hypothetical protein